MQMRPASTAMPVATPRRVGRSDPINDKSEMENLKFQGRFNVGLFSCTRSIVEQKLRKSKMFFILDLGVDKWRLALKT